MKSRYVGKEDEDNCSVQLYRTCQSPVVGSWQEAGKGHCNEIREQSGEWHEM